MANWGVPDFDGRSAAQQEIDRAADGLREKLRSEGKMDRWDMDKYHVEAGYDAREIQEYCVRNEKWQKCRLSMKGVPTDKKLQICKDWWDQQMLIGMSMHRGEENKDIRKHIRHVTELQVGNYLGALRRGGQLDGLNRVRKYL